MGFVSKNSISYIVIMRNLYFIKKDCIFEFCGISDNCSFSHNYISTDKCTMADFRILTDNSRPIDISSWSYFGNRCRP